MALPGEKFFSISQRKTIVIIFLEGVDLKAYYILLYNVYSDMCSSVV